MLLSHVNIGSISRPKSCRLIRNATLSPEFALPVCVTITARASAHEHGRQIESVPRVSPWTGEMGLTDIYYQITPDRACHPELTVPAIL